MVQTNFVSPAFFRALDMPLLAGREFDDADAAGAPQVAIVNERFAERFGLGGDALGQRVTAGGDDIQIVGVAADAKYDGVRTVIEPQVMRPRRQSTTLGIATFYVRGARPREDLLIAVRDTVSRVDPTVPITDLRTMREQVHENLTTERFVAEASATFALLATLLAGLGLYGVLAYGVTQRARELGLRFALGAPASRLRGMVLRQVALMAAAGTLVGTAVAVFFGRAAGSLLFEVEPADPVALAAAAVLLAIIALGSAYIPARRASRVDPMVVLRYE